VAFLFKRIILRFQYPLGRCDNPGITCPFLSSVTMMMVMPMAAVMPVMVMVKETPA
jgi:hypothetical protein